MVIAPLESEHKFLGRQAIYTSREGKQINENTIPDIINGVMPRHLVNRAETEYLFRYFKGYQPILEREKLIRPDVNNRVVINNALAIVRNANGYFLGEPIQYAAKKQEDSDNVSKLNDMMDSENKACEDMSVGSWCSICGHGFRLVDAGKDGADDEAPFGIPTLDPHYTEVIYSTKVGHPAVLAFTYNELLNDDGSTVGTTFTVYDKDYQYIYTVKGGYTTKIQPKNLISKKPHYLGNVPIVEYLNNEWRMGDFEMVITILDAINKLHSDRMNSVEQLVNSILVFIGCHLPTAEEDKAKGGKGVSGLDQLKENLAIELPNADGNKADVKYVSSNVNQNEAEVLAQTLIDYVYSITGIPDRKQKNGGTGDTGDAVYLRDGFQSLEVVARVKERNFKKAERTVLRMVCNILKIYEVMDLKPMQIEVKFVRNRTNNLLNMSQAFANFVSTQQMSPEDAISLIGVTSDPKGMAQRGQEYWDSVANKQVTTDSTNAQKTDDQTQEEINADSDTKIADN
jgi:SPP1 family phage portal protein